MDPNYISNQYKNSEIKTASKEKILLLLYQEAIKCLKNAAVFIEKKNIKKKGESIQKAYDILNEFLNTLNFEANKDIARQLEALYNYMIAEITNANLMNKQEPLLKVAKLLETLLSAWEKVVKKV